MLKRLICFFIISFLLFISTNSFAESPTILLYMLGCDLEEEAGAATDDIVEIMHITKQIPVQVIIYLGGSSRWWLPGLKDNHCYDLIVANNKICVLEDFGTQQSATVQNLTRFLQRYGKEGDDLILWGHGFAEEQCIGVDKLYSDDYLTIGEIQKAIRNSGLHFRMIGFDACKMATLEAIWSFSEYADYFVASSEWETLKGWDYEALLQCLSDSSDPLEKVLHTSLEKRTRKNTLTIIKESIISDSIPLLTRVFDTMPMTSFPTDINQIAKACSDRDAGEKTVQFFGEQNIIISGNLPDMGVLPPSLLDSYLSFVTRINSCID